MLLILTMKEVLMKLCGANVGSSKKENWVNATLISISEENLGGKSRWEFDSIS